MDLLERLGLRKKKTRREQVQETVSDTFQSFANTLDEVVAETRKLAPKATRTAQKQAKKARKETSKVAQKAKEQVHSVAAQVSDVASDARHQAGDFADTLREQGMESRERVADAAFHAGEMTQEKAASLLAALGGLTADWGEVLGALNTQLEQRGAQAEEAVKSIPRPKLPKRKKRRYPGLWLWLLRLGVGFWFLSRVRGRDLSDFIDYGAGDQLRVRSQSHPVAEYKDLLDNFLIPNSSLYGLLVVAAEALAGLGLLTGVNRRLAALLGTVISSNDLLLDYEDAEKRGQNLALLFAQLLLLRTGS